MSSKKTLGISRNKFETMNLIKEARRKKASRFAKENLSGLSDFYSISPSTLKNPLTIEMEKMPTMTSLPPEWVQKYHECLDIIKSIDDIKKQVLHQQNRRLNLVKVSQEKQSERKIYDLTTTATKKIKQCERLLQQIKKQDVSESDSDHKTKNSVCVSLAIMIQDKTKQLRGQQKAFLEHRKNLQNSTRVSFLDMAAERAYDLQIDDQIDDDKQRELQLKISQQRNEEILKIVQSIHELNDLYKELNNLVIMQGSLLDRIDYNIEESSVHVKKGTEVLQKLDERQKKSKCACYMIAVMVAAMLILGIILIVKWSKN